MEKYLVTGGAGFIGSNIVKELVKQGDQVFVLDNLNSGNIKNLESVKKQIKFIKGDIRDLITVKKAVKYVDYVLHQAALRGVFQSVKNPLEVNEVNITGTLNVLVAARDASIKKVVFASSSSVYGKSKSGRNSEKDFTYPQSPYALTKLAGENYCRLFSELFGLDTIALRYFNVFGPYQSPKDPYAAVIPIFTNNLTRGLISEIHGTGKQTRDFTYVDNVVQANIKAAQSRVEPGQAFNIANGENTSIKNLYLEISNILGKDIKPKFVPRRAGDVSKTHADISKAKKYLSYNPQVNFHEGLKKYLSWYLNK